MQREKLQFFHLRKYIMRKNLLFVVLSIAPINSKFAEQLSHRDFLGAVLNLGINRNKIGDIFVKEQQAYVYCKEDISAYIMENLFKIRHTQVTIHKTECRSVNVIPNLKEITVLFQTSGWTV